MNIKRELVLLSLLSIIGIRAQVGIYTDNPKATLDIRYKAGASGNQGVLFPKMTKAQRNAMQNPPQGLIIFNETASCLQVNLGTPSSPNWDCIGSDGENVVATYHTPIPPSVKVKDGEKIFVSIYDNDYLPYPRPTALADFSTYNAGGGTEPLINVQGVISTAGVEVKIPIDISGGNVLLPAYTSEDLLISANKTQDGQARNIVLSWEQQTLTANSKYIVGKLKSKGGDLKIKKLDVNRGIGYDGKGVLLGEFVLPQSSGTLLARFSVRAIAGIPDRKFFVQTQGEYRHRFLYLPSVPLQGKAWLLSNLGADYANIDHPVFDMSESQRAKSPWDIHGFGSLFQWGRPADGHELIDWTDSDPDSVGEESGTPKYNMGWKTNQQLSSTWTPATNPCPEGFHVPTNDEYDSYFIYTETYNGVYSGNISDADSPRVWRDPTIRRTAAGIRNTSGAFVETSVRGSYWSSTPAYSNGARYMWFDNYHTNAGHSDNINYRSAALSIRCRQD